MGQLVLIKVKYFTLRGTSSNVTAITCQLGATWGLSILQSNRVEVSNIQISHCSARLQLEESYSEILTDYNEMVTQYLEYNLSSCDTNNDSFPACYTFLTSFESEKVTIFKTTILHSKGVGIFCFNNLDLDISKSLLAYNQINSIIFVLDNAVTNFNMSQSQVMFGQTKSYSFQFASGLNLFVIMTLSECKKTYNLYLTNVVLTNNKGEHGNFYMVVSIESVYNVYNDDEDLLVNLLITNNYLINPDRGSITWYNHNIQNLPQ